MSTRTDQQLVAYRTELDRLADLWPEKPEVPSTELMSDLGRVSHRLYKLEKATTGDLRDEVTELRKRILVMLDIGGNPRG